MLRIPLVILLILSMLTQSLSRGIIVLSYFTNKQAYERYCINKAKPQLHCDGKCQVAKKIKDEEARDQKDPLKGSSFSEVVMIDQHHFATVVLIAPGQSSVAKLFPLSIGCTRGHARSLFHPPGAAA